MEPTGHCLTAMRSLRASGARGKGGGNRAAHTACRTVPPCQSFFVSPLFKRIAGHHQDNGEQPKEVDTFHGTPRVAAPPAP